MIFLGVFIFTLIIAYSHQFTEYIEYDFTTKFGGPIISIAASPTNGSKFYAKLGEKCQENDECAPTYSFCDLFFTKTCLCIDGFNGTKEGLCKWIAELEGKEPCPGFGKNVNFTTTSKKSCRSWKDDEGKDISGRCRSDEFCFAWNREFNTDMNGRCCKVPPNRVKNIDKLNMLPCPRGDPLPLKCVGSCSNCTNLLTGNKTTCYSRETFCQFFSLANENGIKTQMFTCCPKSCPMTTSTGFNGRCYENKDLIDAVLKEVPEKNLTNFLSYISGLTFEKQYQKNKPRL